MSLLLNRCRFTTATTGTGTLTVGSASSGFQTPASAGAVNGGVYSYFIEDGSAWEIGTGTYTVAGTTLSRTLIQSSTGSLLNLSGSAVVTIAPNVADFLTPDLFGAPGVPAPGLVRLGESSFGVVDLPSFRSAQYPERFFQAAIGSTRFGAVIADPTLGNTPVMIGANWRITQVSNNAAGFAGTNYVTRQPRYTLVNSQTAGAMGSIYCSIATAQPLFIGTGSGGKGFVTEFGGGPGTGCNTANYRAFMGLTSSVSAPTNVDPMTLTNVIGLVRMPGSNNLQIIWAGSQSMTAGGRTAIDLGANFPANTVDTDFYKFRITSNPNDNSQIGYRVDRYTGDSNTPSNTISGTIANITPGTTLPATTTALSMSVWATNNTTADWANWNWSYWRFEAD